MEVHGVKEVWIYGYHFGEVEPDESRMSSRYGDICNSFPREESISPALRLPLFANSYVLYNFTYQPGEAHTARSSCGNGHWSPNWSDSANHGYRYDLFTFRESNCETWRPDESRTAYISLNCARWGCTDVGFYRWYMQNIPGYKNSIVYQGWCIEI